MNQNPALTVYVGPMFSGKTSRLLSDVERFKLQRRHVLVFKPAIDDRYSNSDVVSHSGWKWPAITVKEGADVLEVLTEVENAPDVVAVDEAFMIPGIADVLIWLYRTGITIVVSTLDLNYQAKPFNEVEKLLPYATRIEKCAAVCVECGRDAFYTHKKTTSAEEIENGIEIGGSELYEPRCFRHHPGVDNRPKIHID
jgi:thymidine kinase